VSIVAGVDFGTLSVRVSIFDSARGRLGSGVAEYPLFRRKEDPDHATQSHADHMRALAEASRRAIEAAGVDGRVIEAMALDTTGSSVIPVDDRLQPLDDYYLWCDHRAWKEAGEITSAASILALDAIDWCGGIYSSEWGFAKLLHWLRHNPAKRARFATALEHCDMVAATLCGIADPAAVPRSVCAMGHKWMWNAQLGGLPPEDFLTAVDPLLAGVREKLGGRYATSDQIAGRLTPAWAEKLGLRGGIPIPVGAFDAHWDAIGAGVRLGDVVNVVGTSTCIMAIGDAPRGQHGGGDVPRSGAISRGRNRAHASHLGQWRPHRAGEPRAGWHYARLEAHAYRARRVVRGHRGHGVPYAHHSRALGGVWRPGAPHHKWRRHPPKERRAQPGLR
jgi:L-ribulokinase